MKWLLLVYNNQNGDLAVTAFDEAKRAFSVLNRREAEKADYEEVVLFLAPSVDDLRRTHPRFFPADSEAAVRVAAG